MADEKKDNTVPASTAAAPTTTTTIDPKVMSQFTELLKVSQANNTGNSTGVVYTQQEADAGVQATYQQLLGRNALGADYKKALAIYLNQSQDTSGAGRAQAVADFITQTPEYRARQENDLLDGLYTMMDKDIRRARA
jgi:hypothetical protein